MEEKDKSRNLHERLRIHTRQAHNQIEKNYFFSLILHQEISLIQYKELLSKLYGFIRPCEAMINQLPYKEIVTSKLKEPLLKNDLKALGVINLEDVNQCDVLPSLTDLYTLLGYFYVIEGSTLGGQVITKLLQKGLKITKTNGGSYFLGYGDQTLDNWQHFCKELNQITDKKQQDNIIKAAQLTFQTLNQWLNIN